jgi:aspartyl-tRNA synthetase
VESLVKTIWKEVEGYPLPDRFSVMTYHDAMRTVRNSPSQAHSYRF